MGKIGDSIRNFFDSESDFKVPKEQLHYRIDNENTVAGGFSAPQEQPQYAADDGRGSYDDAKSFFKKPFSPFKSKTEDYDEGYENNAYGTTASDNTANPFANNTSNQYTGYTAGNTYGESENSAPAGGMTANPPLGKLNVQILKPVSVSDDIEKLAKAIMHGDIVCISLEKCTDATVKTRMMVFIAGVVFAQSGHFFRLMENCFIAIPGDMNISADAEELIKTKFFRG